ncbi:nucleotidyltransferase domain-containing protein [Patescibacteria group bacterium]|nr:nucleotidyltransferase domain-containing protein [Patescibacteria group bacterium]
MSKSEAEGKIRDITKKIVKEYAPEKIILFGSFAWGKPSPDSDVDFFIVKDTKKPRRMRQRELRAKLFPPGMALDLLVYTPDEVQKRGANDFFVQEIIQKGKTLYESKK